MAAALNLIGLLSFTDVPTCHSMIASILAGLVGVPAGVAIDEISRRLAAEWHELSDDSLATWDAEVKSNEHPLHVLGSRWLLRDGSLIRRGAVVVTTAGLFAGAGARYPEIWQMAVVCGFMAVLVACSATDITAHRIPDVLSYPAAAAALMVGLVSPSASTQDVLLGGAVAGGLLLAYALLPQGGLGDAKLALFMGLALGLRLLVPALLIMAMVGGVIALLLVPAISVGARRAKSPRPTVRAALRQAFRTPVPYGPNIAIGMATVMLLSGTAFHSF